MYYYETREQKQDTQIHKQSVQSTEANAKLSLSGTLSLSRDCEVQDPQDPWEVEPGWWGDVSEPKSGRSYESMRVRIGEIEMKLQVRNPKVFEDSVEKILTSKGIEGILGMAIKIILLQKCGKCGPAWGQLRERLISQYTEAKLLEVSTL